MEYIVYIEWYTENSDIVTKRYKATIGSIEKADEYASRQRLQGLAGPIRNRVRVQPREVQA